MSVRLRFAPVKGDTCCTFVVRQDVRAIDGNVYCGRIADGPHPDPEISYRQPLCSDHIASVEFDMAVQP